VELQELRVHRDGRIMNAQYGHPERLPDFREDLAGSGVGGVFRDDSQAVSLFPRRHNRVDDVRFG
jgi:hypothetical protein